MRTTLALLAILLAGCPSRSQIVLLDQPGGPPVELGRYPDYLVMLSGADPLAKKAEQLRHDVETHESVLRGITRNRMQIKGPLEFRFMYVGHDSVNSRLILRYFSFDAKPVVIAGWQVQLVYTMPSYRLVKAYVDSVPLE